MSTSTKLHESEKGILAGEERFKNLFNGIGQPVLVHQIDETGFGNIIEANEAACRVYGYAREDLLKLSFMSLTVEGVRQEDSAGSSLRRLEEEGNVLFLQTHKSKEGKIFPVEISSNLYNWSGQRVVLSVVNKTGQQVAVETYSRAYNIINRGVAVVFIWKAVEGWPVEFVSENVVGLFGYTVSDFIESKISYGEIIHRGDIDRVREEVLNAGKDQSIRDFTHEPYRIITKNNEVKWLSDVTSVCRDSNGVISHYEGIVYDITKRKLAEIALLESEAKYRLLIENSNDAIYLLYNRKFEIINSKFAELFGVSNEQTKAQDFNILELVAPESRSLIAERLQAIAEGKEVATNFEFKAIDAQRNILLLEAAVSRIPYKDGFATQGVLRNITEKKKFEQQLQHTQKMEAIGTLAGGIAHDFNNLLTVINGYSEMELQTLDKKDRVYKTFQAILQAGKKAVTLTSQLLAFSRKQIYKTETIEINGVISEMEKMLRRLIGEDINIDTHLSESLSQIKADRSQLEQIFVNLVVNARDAVRLKKEPGYEPKISIETGQKDIDDDFVFISVSDNGIGMDEDTRQKIFEPFFTTKNDSQGTGLGLAMVYGIVKQNGGSIYVYSELDQGTTIKIYWPVSPDKMVPLKGVKKVLPNVTGDENILFVEDDQELSAFASKALKSLGYNVTTAVNGLDALEIFESNSDTFDIIITDLIMPKLNGRDFVKKVKFKKPDMKVIYVSGYTDNHIVHNGLLKPGVNFMQKPYSIETLAQRIRQILDDE